MTYILRAHGFPVSEDMLPCVVLQRMGQLNWGLLGGAERLQPKPFSFHRFTPQRTTLQVECPAMGVVVIAQRHAYI